MGVRLNKYCAAKLMYGVNSPTAKPPPRPSTLSKEPFLNLAPVHHELGSRAQGAKDKQAQFVCFLCRDSSSTSTCKCKITKICCVTCFMISTGSMTASWSVTFKDPDICAVRGSSVKFRCSYNYADGETVQKTAWYKGQSEGGIWRRVELSVLPLYQNRTEYQGDRHHDCSLVIHDLQHNDTGYYYFRFDTDRYGWRSKASVHLSVTELSVRVYPVTVRAGDNVTLQCGTSCQPSSTVWFKDGRPGAKPEFQAQAEDSGNYMCAIEGQKLLRSGPVALDVQYPPLNVSIEVSHPGPLANGSVNLTCSSAANPAADSYTWYKRTDSFSSSSLLQVGSGQVLSLQVVEKSHRGAYLCQARNSLGENNSTEVPLAAEETDIDLQIILIGIGVKVGILVLLSLALIWVWSMSMIMKISASPNHMVSLKIMYE
uniref:Cd22 molecule n=1 Tax=Mastacembelus armatus TaxID=205130 RepID=A0A3Q3KIU2_9TELE